jgi:hypothetical protein
MGKRKGSGRDYGCEKVGIARAGKELLARYNIIHNKINNNFIIILYFHLLFHPYFHSVRGCDSHDTCFFFQLLTLQQVTSE